MNEESAANEMNVQLTPLLAPTVAVLFAREDSIYKELPGCDVWDKERNAMIYDDDLPIVAHPPCRAWGQLRKFAKPEPGERNLARLAVALIRKNGGVLEHPKSSQLWSDQQLPEGQAVDEYGGFTLHVDQYWWGHKARKSTRLYVCGCRPGDVPRMPMVFGEPKYVVDTRRKDGTKKYITKAEREATPVEFAKWLCNLARICSR